MKGRHSPLPPPAPQEFSRMLLNVLVRDYPETLAVLKRHGVETTEHGSESLEDILARRSDIDRGRMSREVSGALREALEWRVSDGP